MTDQTLIIKYDKLKEFESYFECQEFKEGITPDQIQVFKFLVSVCKYNPIKFDTYYESLKLVICYPEGSKFTEAVKNVLTQNGILQPRLLRRWGKQNCRLNTFIRFLLQLDQVMNY